LGATCCKDRTESSPQNPAYFGRWVAASFGAPYPPIRENGLRPQLQRSRRYRQAETLSRMARGLGQLATERGLPLIVPVGTTFATDAPKAWKGLHGVRQDHRRVGILACMVLISWPP
jgi:hypothetical protein